MPPCHDQNWPTLPILPRIVQFYGQKLFQSTFVNIIVPGATVLEQMLYILLNNGVALVGCKLR